MQGYNVDTAFHQRDTKSVNNVTFEQNTMLHMDLALKEGSFALKYQKVMVEWLKQASQWHGRYCHDLEVMSSKPGQVELGVHATSILSRTWTKNTNLRYFVQNNLKEKIYVSSLNKVYNIYGHGTYGLGICITTPIWEEAAVPIVL